MSHSFMFQIKEKWLRFNAACPQTGIHGHLVLFGVQLNMKCGKTAGIQGLLWQEVYTNIEYLGKGQDLVK